MGSWVHRVTDGVCACGCTTLVRKDGRDVCGDARRAQRGVKSKSYTRKDHGLTTHEARQLCELAGECAICGATEKLVVDHDHTTKDVRGVLCHHCNVGLGFFKDDPIRLSQAIAYLT